MKKVPVSECPAGPEMDNAVAKALGWKFDGGNYRLWQMPSGEWRSWEETSFRGFRPSTDIAEAWELAEAEGLALVPQSDGDGYHWLALDLIGVRYADDIVLVEKGDTGHSAETAPLAICRAFLVTNGVEFVEMG